MSSCHEPLKQKALEIVSGSRIPIDPEFVSKRVGIAWGTARFILLELALEGKVRATKTSKSWVFSSIDLPTPSVSDRSTPQLEIAHFAKSGAKTSSRRESS